MSTTEGGPGVSPRNRAIEGIRWYLRERGLEPGQSLPPERRLCQILGISRTALRGALASLEGSHILTARRGSGTYVADRAAVEVFQETPTFSEAARSCGMEPGTLNLESGLEAADPIVAAKLGIEPGATVFRIRRLRTLDGRPAAIENAWVDVGRCPGIEDVDLGEQSLYSHIWERYGIKICHGDEAISIAVAEDEDALLLDLDPGTPVLFFEGLERDARQRPVEYGRDLIRPDRYRFASVQGPAWLRKRMEQRWPLL